MGVAGRTISLLPSEPINPPSSLPTNEEKSHGFPKAQTIRATEQLLLLDCTRVHTLTRTHTHTMFLVGNEGNDLTIQLVFHTVH